MLAYRWGQSPTHRGGPQSQLQEKSNFIGVRGSLKKVGETTCEKKPEEQGTMGVRQGTGKGENISQGHLNIE